MDNAGILLLAAGSSSRMRGADKLLQPVGGQTLLRRQARAMAGLGVPVIVTLPVEDAARHAALSGLGVRAVPVPDANDGMSASIRAGVAAARGKVRGLALLPADMPGITAPDVRLLLARFAAEGSDRVVRATGADGTPGHPVIFPARLFAALAALQGDSGARPVLAGEDVVWAALPGRRALIDLDTPEDWAAWRALAGKT